MILSTSTAGAGNFSIGLDYACLSLDGAPIPKGSALAAKCCVAKPDPECRVGFSSVVPVSVEDTKGYFDLVREGIRSAAALNGIDLDHRNPNQSTRVGEQPGGDSSAVLSGNLPSSTESQSTMKGGGAGAISNGGGSGAGNAQGSGIMGAKGSSGATQGRDARAVAVDEFGGGKYLGNGGSGARSGTDGKMAEVAAGEVQELTFGDIGKGGGGAAGSLNADGSDSEGMSGTPEDSPDYLNRIDKSASIFKIVSKRYEKELARNRLRIPEIPSKLK